DARKAQRVRRGQAVPGCAAFVAVDLPRAVAEIDRADSGEGGRAHRRECSRNLRQGYVRGAVESVEGTASDYGEKIRGAGASADDRDVLDVGPVVPDLRRCPFELSRRGVVDIQEGSLGAGVRAASADQDLRIPVAVGIANIDGVEPGSEGFDRVGPMQR